MTWIHHRFADGASDYVTDTMAQKQFSSRVIYQRHGAHIKYWYQSKKSFLDGHVGPDDLLTLLATFQNIFLSHAPLKMHYSM